MVMRPPSTPDTIKLLASTGRPVAIVDCLGDWDLSDVTRSAPNVRVFSFCSGDQAAREAVRYLLQRGHRSIAFVSPYRTRPWSQVRTTTIRDEMQRSGLGRCFTDFSFDIEEEIEARGKPSPRASAQKLSATIGSAISGLPEGAALLEKTNIFHQDFLLYHLLHCHLSDLLNEKLPALLEHQEISAWVCVNDITAGWVLKFLRSRHIPIPARLSVIAFDDTAQALNTGLTSYNFNAPALVNTVLNFLLNPRLLGTRYRTGALQIKGSLVERASSGPARV